MGERFCLLPSNEGNTMKTMRLTHRPHKYCLNASLAAGERERARKNRERQRIVYLHTTILDTVLVLLRECAAIHSNRWICISCSYVHTYMNDILLPSMCRCRMTPTGVRGGVVCMSHRILPMTAWRTVLNVRAGI